MPVSRASFFWSKVLKSSPSECWLWQGAKSRKGYGWFRWDSGPIGAHRAAWLLEHGPIPAGLCVCHHCDNPACVNPAHLFLGTNHDNVSDSVAKGRHEIPRYTSRGENHSRAKITAADVLWIRSVFGSPGYTSRKLGAKFGLSKTSIMGIVHRLTWTHV